MHLIEKPDPSSLIGYPKKYSSCPCLQQERLTPHCSNHCRSISYLYPDQDISFQRQSQQKEFCPTLDSSLIAALLFELESDNDGNRVVPTSDQIDSLRATLQELCAQADESECLSDVDETFIEQTVSSALSSFDVDNEGSSLTELSQKSGSSFTSFTSPLGFLQMVLPDIPPAKLKKALDTHNGKDLWDIISVIVSEEAIRETEERDLEDGETNKEVVRSDKEDMKASKQKTAKKTKSTKFVLSDVRQQNRTGQESSRRRSGSVSDISSSQSGPPTVDPWTRISSLSSRLASLLPPHPPSIFSSFLHSPQYATSYDAVRACLRSLCKSNNLSDEQSTLLISLLDIIMVSDDIEVRSQVISDVELSVCVTEGRADDALDLAYLLHDLESSTGLRPNRFHSLPSPSATNFSQGQPSLLPPGGSLPTRPSLLQHLPGSTSPPQSSHKVKVLQWQAVPSRTKFNKTAHVGYANYTNDPSTSNQARLRMRHAKEKSRQALMDATIMFRQRNSRNYGGEVALFYAERVCKIYSDIHSFFVVDFACTGERVEAN